MYIFELAYKLVQKVITKKAPKEEPAEKTEEEICEHVFLPVDSTKKTLACTKCGLLIKTDDILNKGQTEQKDSV